MAVCASLNTPGVVTYNQPPGPKRLQQRHLTHATADTQRPSKGPGGRRQSLDSRKQPQRASDESDLPVSSRRDLLKGSASLTIGGFASRAIRLLGGGAVAERVVLSAAELYAKVGAELHPTVQHLLKIGVRPADVMRMVQNPALRPKNMAQLQQWIR